MSQFNVVLDRYRSACEALCNGEDVYARAAAFAILLIELEAGALADDPHCQDAVATILGYGLCYATGEEALANRARDRGRATRLWTAAAKQGLWGSYDNLVTRGVGPDADKAREVWEQLAEEQPELVGHSNCMPVYGPPFVQVACQRFAKC